MKTFTHLLGVGGMALVQGTPTELSQMRFKLMQEARNGNGDVKKIRLYKDLDVGEGDVDQLLVPRAMPEVTEAYEAKLADHYQGRMACPKAEIDMTGKLRPLQKRLTDQWFQGILDGASFGGILQSPTGSGKTFMGLHIASKLKQPTLIIVPRSVLMEQWKQRILEHTDVEEDAIGVARQGVCDFKGKTFVIGLIHSLARRTYPKEFYDRFGLVIFDEVHVLGAETFATVAPKFNSAYRLGLSATPRRKDGMENAFLWHIGPILTKTQVHHVKPRVRQIYFRSHDCSDTGMWWAGKFQFARWLNRIAKSPSRNLLIANLVKTLYERDEDILLLSDRLNQINIIRETLKGWGIDEEVGLFTGKVKQLDRKILLGTYGSADMGADLPRLSALVFATPRVDIVQAVGRVLREGTPTVVDVVDASADIMTRWAQARLKRYRRMTDDIKVQDYKILGAAKRV